MIEQIHLWQNSFVEPSVFVCAKVVDDYTSELTANELEVIASSVAIRRNTYSTGRFCAKNALQESGVDRCIYADGLLRQEDGSVAWPKGTIGSISHTNDWAIAAITKTGQGYVSLGIDIEKIDRVEKSVLRLIATDDERAHLKAEYELRWGRVALFSIKESLYKCLRPLYGEFFGFQDVQISDLNTALPNTPRSTNKRSDKAEITPEIYCPTVKLLLPSLAQCCDEQRIRVRIAVLPKHVVSLVSYHSDAL